MEQTTNENATREDGVSETRLAASDSSTTVPGSGSVVNRSPRVTLSAVANCRNTQTVSKSFTLAELGEALRPRGTTKDGRAVCGAVFDPPFRKLANVVEVGALVLDVDDAEGELGDLTRSIADYEQIVWTTWSHTDEQKPKFRVLLPLKRPVTVDEYAVLWREVNALLGGIVDKSTKDASRLMYTPRETGKSGRPANVVVHVPPSHASKGWLDPDSFNVREKAARQRPKTERRPVDVDQAELQSALEAIDPASLSRDDWLRVGMGLHDEGCDVSTWDSWSSRDGARYKSGECVKMWDGFGSGSGVTVATVYHLAKQAGWVKPRRERKGASTPPTPELPNGEPMPFLSGNPAPELPRGVLPPVIERYARDQAEVMGCDPAIIGISALAVAAACLDDGIVIQPKQHDTSWTESARLWVAAIGDPSAKKSPAIKKAMRPAFEVEARMRERTQRAQAEHAELVEAGERSEAPKGERLIYSDVTVEAFGASLAKNTPRGSLVHRDELTGWLASMDAYKNGEGKDRAAWLEAYNGGPLPIDRVSRGSLFVPNFSACVVGGIQPTVIRQYAKATSHDGMLQRFILFFAQPATFGLDRPPDREAGQAYEDAVVALSSMRPSGKPVVLSDGARERLVALWRVLHELSVNHPNPFLQAALGKWRGLSARLLLTFHALSCAERGEDVTRAPVGEDDARRVVGLVSAYLLPHAVRFYSELDPGEDRAAKVARWILAHQRERFLAGRDLQRELSESRKWAHWEKSEALERLSAYGWIFVAKDSGEDKYGNPKRWEVSPLVHVLFGDVAEQERERRRAIVEAIEANKALWSEGMS